MKRRTFLAGGGALVLSFAWLDPARSENKAEPSLPGSLKVEPYLDGWIRLDATGQITVMTGKAELGQGIKTALLQIAAEELMVSPETITLVTADTERTANEGVTAGSHSMQDSGTAIRIAAANVRAILIDRAAQVLAVPKENLKLAAGRISAGAQSVAYEDLLTSEVMHVLASKDPSFVPVTERHYIGRSWPRVDIPAKLAGGSAYVQDLRPPGLLHGRIVRPPSPGATLLQIDTAAVERMPGALRTVVDGNFIGVICAGEFQAIVAARTLSDATKWQEEPPHLPTAAMLYTELLAARTEDTTILLRGAPLPRAGGTVSARYLRPYQMHGSIGPSCAVAISQAGKFTVWTHTQGVYPLRRALAEMLGVAEQQVHCVHTEGSGCYGHNGADDVAADAALLARAMPDQAIRVQWMREDEHGWEPLAPPMVVELSASLDRDGQISSWRHDVWSNTHNARPGAAGELLAATELARPFKPSAPKAIPQPEGGGDRNAIALYALPHAQVVHHFVPSMPRRVSAMRSLGAYTNIFAIESFMDELALAARMDPVQFRLRHLDDPRAQDVIRLAAARFGWETFEPAAARGRGFAFARYKNLGAYLALAVEIELWPEQGNVRVVRAVAAVDSGEVVSPDGIRNQIEGAMIQSISWSTLEAVRFDGRGVASLDWASYPILRFGAVPESIEVHIIDRPGQAFLGTGEAAQGPTAAALANAVASATGVRPRELPFTATRIRSLLNGPMSAKAIEPGAKRASNASLAGAVEVAAKS